MDSVSLHIVVPKGEAEKYTELLRQGELQVSPPEPVETPKDEAMVDAKFVEIVAVIAAGAAAAMAARLFDLVVQKRENGTVIDLRKTPPEVTLVRNVPYGTLVVIDANGKSELRKIDPNKTADTQTLIAGIIEKCAKK